MHERGVVSGNKAVREAESRVRRGMESERLVEAKGDGALREKDGSAGLEREGVDSAGESESEDRVTDNDQEIGVNVRGANDTEDRIARELVDVCCPDAGHCYVGGRDVR
jgi:hypothetical protein